MAPPDTVPDISIVVPTRNRRALLQRLLDRLDAIDDGLVYEVIVVDEASSDDTQTYLAGLQPARMQLCVIRHDLPLGPSAARNAGIAAARAPYLSWIDDDDLTSPDRLRLQRMQLASGSARWSIASKVDIDDDLNVIGHTACPTADRFYERILCFNILPAAGQGLLSETELVRSVGAFDPDLRSAEDWDLCIRMAAQGTPAMLDEPHVGYRTGVTSMSTDTGLMLRSIQAVLAKHISEHDRLGIQPDWFQIHRSLLAADALNSRAAVVRRSMHVLRGQPSLKSLVRCAATAVAPIWWAQRSRRLRMAGVPPAWRTFAEGWLRPSM